MLRYQILLDRSYSASTTEIINQQFIANRDDEVVATESLFSSQQEISIQREYYGYETQTGVALVNDLNVKAYLNNPSNTVIANEFLSFLTGSTSLEEFRDIYYDNKKLAEYFNDYYKKIKIYSNQGVSTINVDPSINLFDSKNSLISRDKLYTKTNANTGYIAQIVQPNGTLSNSTPVNLLPTDTINFSGNDESYYVNIPVIRKRIDFYSDDFSQYFVDCCDGNIVYNKYTYINNFTTNNNYGNLDELIQRQSQINLSSGPDLKSVNYLKSLLPVNYLDEQGNIRTHPQTSPLTQLQTQPTSIQGGLYDPSLPSASIIVPQNNQSTSFSNFQSFSSFQTFFNFSYQAWSPDLTNIYDPSKKYFYQQIVDLVMPTNSLFTQQLVSNGSGSMASMQNYVLVGPPNMVLCEFSFIPVPNPFNQNYLGKEFDPLITNQYTFRVLHATPNKADKVILKYEPFSSVAMGPDDKFNYVSFDSNLVNNILETEVVVDFALNQSVKSININVYKNMPERTPMVFSLRPYSNPNQVCQYLIIYLEQFFNFNTYNYFDEIKVSQSTICKLMYNCFVDKKFNDNMFEIQRPDEFPVTFENIQGFSISQNFQDINIADVNNKLLNVFYNQNINLYEISTFVGVPQSGIYNIYIWGSYLFGTDDAFSDADLIVVADGQTEVRQFKRNGLDIAVYNPTGFQKELSEFTIKIFNATVSTDRVFTVYNSTDEKYKILERIDFVSDANKQKIKTKAKQFLDERWSSAEEAFNRSDFDASTKRIWSIFRNLIFAIQYLQNNKIEDITAANSYLDDLRNSSFSTWGQVVNYFYPKIQKLYSDLLAL